MSPPPPGQPKETCFFWYHGECRRGDRCHLAHETHITWPISVPPGYVHRIPCDLPLCPLRHDMVAFKEGTRKREQTFQIAQRVHERSREDSDVRVINSQASLKDNSPRSHLRGISSEDSSSTDSESSDSDPDSTEEGVTEAITISDTPSEISSSAPSLTATLPPSHTEEEKPHITSISHPGTRIRKHPFTLDQNGHKRRRLDAAGGHSVSFPTHDIPSKLESIPHTSLATQHHPASVRQPPRGPKTQEQDCKICFYWYHKGYCRTKLRGGYYPRCNYLHTLDTEDQRVSLPPGIRDHDPNCPLPLCPVRLLDQGKLDAYHKAMDNPPIKSEPVTPPKAFSGPDPIPYPSPRQDIIAARRQVRGPKFNTPEQTLPNLTGKKRARFNYQREQIEKWQTENGIQELGRRLTTKEKRKERKEKQQKFKQRQKEARINRKKGKLSRRTTTSWHAKREESEEDWFLKGFPDCAPKVVQRQHDEKELEQKIAVLVDYELPEGEDRADWDTDSLRRAFGEIA